ncbi:MAG: phage major capsid protein [Castellaniella sp.]
MTLAEIREVRAAKVAEMRSLLADNKTLTPDQQKAFDALKAEVTSLEAQEARQQFLDDAERRAAGTPVTGGDSLANLESRVSVLDVIRAQVEGRSLAGAAAEYSQETERRTGRKAQGVFVPLAAIEQRANTTTTAPELVPTDHRADQYIEPFRNALLARRLGVRVLSGLAGNVSIPKYGTGTSVGWVAEGSALSTSDMSFDSVTLAPKHAGGISEMSRQLIMQSSPDIEALVRSDLSTMLAQAIDTALIAGTGTSNQPTGVLTVSGTTSKSLATLSWANVLEMIEAAELDNAPVSSWLTHPAVMTKLRSTLKESGLPGYLLEGGRLADLPVSRTTQVPATPGTPNTGRLILGDWSQVMLGIWSEVDILVNPFAETPYSKGNILIRAMSTVDIANRHPEAFVIADDLAL